MNPKRKETLIKLKDTNSSERFDRLMCPFMFEGNFACFASEGNICGVDISIGIEDFRACNTFQDHFPRCEEMQYHVELYGVQILEKSGEGMNG